MIHSKWGGVKASCVLVFCRDKTRHYGDPHHPQLLQIVSYGQGLSQQIVHFGISRQMRWNSSLWRAVIGDLIDGPQAIAKSEILVK